MSTDPRVLLAVDGPVATVTFNRPAQHNAFDRPLLHELEAVLAGLADSAEVRVVVLTGAGERAFSAGADLVDLVDVDAGTVRDYNRIWISLLRTMERLPQPVIASVRGHAVAGGTELTLACDLVIAADDAVFGLTEIRVGVIPGAGACVRLPRWVGRAAAKELLMLGDPVPAAEALRMGLVNRVVAAADLGAETNKLALRLASRPAQALAAVKRAVNVGGEMDLDRGIDYVLMEFAFLFTTWDQREGMQAFLEKRPPAFRGH